MGGICPAILTVAVRPEKLESFEYEIIAVRQRDGHHLLGESSGRSGCVPATRAQVSSRDCSAPEQLTETAGEGIRTLDVQLGKPFVGAQALVP